MNIFSFYRDRSFRVKLAVPMVFVGIILLFIALIGVRNISSVSASADRIANKYLPAVNSLLRLDRNLYRIQTAERSLIFLKVGNDDYNKMVRQQRYNLEEIAALLENLNGIFELSEHQTKRQEVNEAFSAWQQTTLTIEKELSEGGRLGRRTAIDLSFGSGNTQFEKVRDGIVYLIEATVQASNAQVAGINALSISSKRSQIIAAVIGLLSVIGIAILFPKLLMEPLKKLLERVEAISKGDGDLTARVDVNSNDELGKLGESFNVFLSKLHGIIGQVANSVSQLASAAEELSSITREANQATERQNTNIGQVTQEIHRMSTTVQEITQSTGEAANSAQKANASAQDGSQVVQEAIVSIGTVEIDVNSAADVVRELSQDSDNIGGVLDVIKSIAEQTNLLALNAAIEAARAGEQGRGFAVVADEVRSLAGRTQQATQEIKGMIERLQQGAQNAVSAMESGQIKVRKCVLKSKEAGVSLESITESVAMIVVMNSQIAAAAQDQSQVAKNVNCNLSEINEITFQSASSAKEVRLSGEALAHLAASLQDQVNQFKI
jgi:methyl-accepting chemotaxis protein